MPISQETNELAKDLVIFMQNKFGFKFLPKIKFISNKKNASNVLGMTGGYDQGNEEITVYVANRHPKDILRSLAHEMIHHVQKCEGRLNNENTASTRDPNYIMHDDYLKKIEADAFERGNITFREWEATKKGGKQMNEEKKMSKPTLKKAHKAAKSALKSGGFKQYSDPESVAYATMTKKAKEDDLEEASYEKSGLDAPEKADLDKNDDISGYEMKRGKAVEKNMKENKEVEINPALKNSHNYSTVTRALPEVAKERDEFVYQELLRKFGIKK